MKKTKVIWMIDGLGPGGAEKLMTVLLKHFDKNEYEMRICVLQDRENNIISDKLRDMGISIDFVHVKRLRNPFNIAKILTYLKQQKPTIIHTQLEFSDVLGNISARMLGIPSVSTIHTLDEFPTFSRAFWRNQLRWFFLRNFCTRIISVSEKVREHLIKFGRVNPSKIVTIYNGIEIEAFEISRTSNSSKILHLPEDSKIICTVAVLREPKGIQFMIDALPAICQSISNIHYVIVGNGAYEPQLRSLVESKGVSNLVTFLGHREDVPQILAASDIFVLPTLIDALPTVLIEAMAAQKAIIASDVGGIPEIITDHRTGILVPPGDPSRLAQACTDTLHNDNLAKKLAAQAHQTAKERFSVQIQVEQLGKLYQSLSADKSLP